MAPRDAVGVMQPASMKCSSRRNCDLNHSSSASVCLASMKCSSRRNCDPESPEEPSSSQPRLNEVQFPKELRPRCRCRSRSLCQGLNEVQFPKELRLLLGVAVAVIELPQ